MDHLVRTFGFRKAMRVVSFVTCWEIVRRDLGREPTIEEYGEWWKESRATAFRHQQLFREAFPNEETPSRLLDVMSEQRATNIGGVVLA
jgi:hypothetical protein